MRLSSLIYCVAVCASCTFRAPVHGALRLKVEAEVHVSVRPAPPPPTPPPPVALVNAPIVEFFGVPLEGANDVVFLLDSSGSMSEPAQGRIATIAAAPGAAQPAVPPADSAPPGSGPAEMPAPYPGDPNAGAQAVALPSPPAATGPKRSRKIDVAQSELIDALARLPAGTRLNVLFFNGELEAYAPELISLDESRRGDMIRFVAETWPVGGTSLAPAMRTAFLMNARRIVLLSDGLGNIGGGADAVLRDAHEGIRAGVRIDAIGLGGHQDRELLDALARDSGGIYQAL